MSTPYMVQTHAHSLQLYNTLNIHSEPPRAQLDTQGQLDILSVDRQSIKYFEKTLVALIYLRIQIKL